MAAALVPASVISQRPAAVVPFRNPSSIARMPDLSCALRAAAPHGGWLPWAAQQSSLIQVMPRSWRIWCAPTGTTTALSPRTATWPRRLRRWPRAPADGGARRRQVNQLRSTLREFYSAALAAFDDLASGDALAVLRQAPQPALSAALSRTQITAALRRGGRTRRLAERTAAVQAALRASQLQAAPARATAMGAAMTALVGVITEMNNQINALETQLAADLVWWYGRWASARPSPAHFVARQGEVSPFTVVPEDGRRQRSTNDREREAARRQCGDRDAQGSRSSSLPRRQDHTSGPVFKSK